MFKLTDNKRKKALIADISGSIGVEEANRILTEVKNTVRGLNTKEYVLVINPENLSSSLLVLPILQNIVQLIGQLNFKKIYIVNSNKYAGLIKQSLRGYAIADNVYFASTVNEAIKS